MPGACELLCGRTHGARAGGGAAVFGVGGCAESVREDDDMPNHTSPIESVAVICNSYWCVPRHATLAGECFGRALAHPPHAEHPV